MSTPPPLAIFDLDHTLLSGDSDVLWCDFLVRQGLAAPDQQARNQALDAAYRDGSVGVAAYCDFHAALLAGHTPAHWAPWCERFLQAEVLPRIPAAARALVERHRSAGHRLLMSTATNRAISQRTAEALGFEHLIATELELVDGRYSGRTTGTPNMRDGKVARLLDWLSARGEPATGLRHAHFYSDSANDLPLLRAVGLPVVVDPDPRLLAEATVRAWPVLRLVRTP
ncbi:HAD family hydrolase [Rubrivivax sp. RP6-9]|uniref:HAD family hydrolase n=1 Tax=Rubrivivax sp. RP6-9 TaxID=3415750 RepID=UPI003CC6AC4C